LSRVQDFDQLTLKTDAATINLDPTAHYSAKVELRDGRQLKVPVTVAAPRPQVTLMSKGTQDDGNQQASPVHLGSADDVPLGSRLVFFVKSVVPQSFPRNGSVEVAADDGSFRTVLTLADGSLMLEDTKTALASVEPLTRFGSSAFGPVHARVLSADGMASDWFALGTLIRLPVFKELRCPRTVSKPCMLVGANLFLAQSIASAQDFTNPIDVPADFTGTQLSVPHPASGVLYLKLRDDPGTVQTLTLPVLALAPGGPAATQTTAIQTQPAVAAPGAEPPAAAKPEH
jgi:hypothetical protein